MSDAGVRNVDRENYYMLARMFCASNSFRESKHINPIDHPQLWGAWFGYFKDKNLSMTHFKSVGREAARLSKVARAGWGYQVPASLPSDFDDDRSPASDLAAGDGFMAAQDRKRKKVSDQVMTKDEKAEVIKTILKKRGVENGNFKVMKTNEIAEILIKKGISQPGWVFSIDGATTPDGQLYSVSELREFISNPKGETT